MDTDNIYQDFLRSRRSIRRFQQKPVEPEKINRIIETAMTAPSAHNRQPWRFAIISDPKIKNFIGKGMGKVFAEDLEIEGFSADEIQRKVGISKSRILNSPIIIILFLDMSEMNNYPAESIKRINSERVMGIQSVAAAGTLIQLAATAEDLAAVWTCWPLFATEPIQNILDTPFDWEPQAMFFIGYPAESPKNKLIIPKENITKYF
ncbi:MAG: nitroreductase family protein [Chloroflexota bacterium]